MKETQIVGKITAHLRKHLLGSVVFKHADRVTAGIPDISVTWRRHTIWFEVKVRREGRMYTRDLQHVNMTRLSKQGSAYYVVFDLDTARSLIVRPQDINGEEFIFQLYGIRPSVVTEFLQSTITEEN